MKNSLTLSFIIPVYNEESHLQACLESIASQSVMPDEVIVVDNNSTDNTAKIAKSFPFVTLIHEKEQGLIPARNKGFKAAKSDILARLDADSILNKDWVVTAKKAFEDESIDAITGPALTFIDPHFPNLQSTFWSKVYLWHSKAVFRFQILWGPNMALRRTAWLGIEDELCTKDHAVHEDQDISVVLTAHNKKLVLVNELVMKTDGRRLAYLPKALEYQKRKKETFALHKANGNLAKARKNGLNPLRAILMMVVVLPLGVVFGILSGLYTIELKLGLRH